MKRILYLVRQTAYTIFSFCYFIGLAVELTVRGFFLLTLGGKTDENKLKYHRILQRKAMLTPKLIILTKNWVWHNPFYGIIIRYADYFPITDTEQMADTVAEKVSKGYSVMIFPEGTRSADSHILRFHRGAFYLAEKLGLDIVPVFIKGFGDVLPKTSFHLHPGQLSLEVMPRIRRDDSSQMGDYREMTKRLHKMYVRKYNEEVCHHR